MGKSLDQLINSSSMYNNNAPSGASGNSSGPAWRGAANDGKDWDYSSIAQQASTPSEKWIAATSMANMMQPQTGNEYRTLQDEYFGKLGGIEQGASYRGEEDNALIGLLDGLGGMLDEAYLAGGNALDFAFDNTIGNAAGIINADLGNEVRNLTTGEDLAIVPEIASDLALMAAAVPTGGATLPVLLGKGVLDNRDNLISAGTGYDRYSGEALTDQERMLRGGAGALNTALNLFGAGALGKGVAKGAAAGIGKAGVSASKNANMAKGALKKADDAFKQAEDVAAKAKAAEDKALDEYATLLERNSKRGIEQSPTTTKTNAANQAFVDAEANTALKEEARRAAQSELGKKQGKLDKALAAAKGRSVNEAKAIQDELLAIANGEKSMIGSRAGRDLIPESLNARKAAMDNANGIFNKARAAAARPNSVVKIGESPFAKLSGTELDDAIKAAENAPLRMFNRAIVPATGIVNTAANGEDFVTGLAEYVDDAADAAREGDYSQLVRSLMPLAIASSLRGKGGKANMLARRTGAGNKLSNNLDALTGSRTARRLISAGAMGDAMNNINGYYGGELNPQDAALMNELANMRKEQ